MPTCKGKTMAGMVVAAPQRIERTAWRVMWLSFVMLCILSVTMCVGIYTFLFGSSVPMQTIIDVGRGTAAIINSDFAEQAERETENVTGRAVSISMDSQSQATLSMQLPGGDDGDNLVAAITIKANSEVRFQQAIMPRFGFTNVPYYLSLLNLRGRIDILIANDFGQSFLMEITTADGRLIQITQRGRYAIDATETRVRLITYEGEAVIYPSDKRNNRIVNTGMQALLYPERAEPAVEMARVNVVENGLFSFGNSTDSGMILPGRWGCTTIQDADPRGIYTLATFEGRSALRLVRGDTASNHGETRCLQPIDKNRQNVANYTYLELDATFLLNYQSLSDCGTQGSECPMMLRFTYTDVNGVPREWFQGFYYNNMPALGYPPRCSSCTQDHLQINEKVWYTFESGNLMNGIPAALRPASITTVEFYASGHQYDLFVGEISMSAGYADSVPEVSQINN